MCTAILPCPCPEDGRLSGKQERKGAGTRPPQERKGRCRKSERKVGEGAGKAVPCHCSRSWEENGRLRQAVLAMKWQSHVCV